MALSPLVAFIIEARKRGFDDATIRIALLKEGWRVDEVRDAFTATREHYTSDNQVCIYLEMRY